MIVVCLGDSTPQVQHRAKREEDWKPGTDGNRETLQKAEGSSYYLGILQQTAATKRKGNERASSVTGLTSTKMPGQRR